MSVNILEWEARYSVGVLEIDDQHKQLFVIINELVGLIHEGVNTESIAEVVDSLIRYKTLHFSTEEKYFKEFNYEETDEHIGQHVLFNKNLQALQGKYHSDPTVFAFELVDMLEDWLVTHLIVFDQRYKQCFISHGLK